LVFETPTSLALVTPEFCCAADPANDDPANEVAADAKKPAVMTNPTAHTKNP
jgi:hypothetical protein